MSIDSLPRKKGVLTLLAAGVVGAGAWLGARHLPEGLPAAWVRQEYALAPQQACKVDQLHRDYNTRCGPFCAEMCKANARLEELALGSASVTPAVREAIVETDQIRTSARVALMEHFYAVAAELPPERRREYLLKVLPLVIDSCGSR
jgi:hypothetical protein